MGDNRYNSADSRFWGFVDKNKVESKAWFVYWSKDPRIEGLEGVNLERVFTLIK